MARKESFFTRLNHHFHEHPRGRLHEMLFWIGLGLLMGGVAFFFWQRGDLSTPLALMLGIVAACLFLWAFLPQRKARPPPPLPKGKRGEIQAKVRENKAAVQKKKRGPGPPIG